MTGRDYILTHRLAGRGGGARHAAAQALQDHLERARVQADILSDSHSQRSARHRRVVRMRADAAWFREHSVGIHPDVILEPRVHYSPHSHLLAGGRILAHTAPATSKDVAVQVTVLGDGQGLEGAEVTLLYRLPGGAQKLLPLQQTDARGRALLHCAADCTPVMVGAYPAGGFWTACAAVPGAGSTRVSTEIALHCDPLPATGPLGWWHHAMGIDRYREDRGRGIKVGILGTGVTPHPCLAHVQRLDGKADLDAHGTHVCGLLAARPVQAGQFAGFAPGAEVITLRVFEMQGGNLVRPDQGHLAHAIDELAVDGDPAMRVDLINMSLGADHSLGLEDAVRSAREHGTLCICSAGNTSGAVEYPAALPETIGVAALGQTGWGPTNSATAFMMPDAKTQADHFGRDGLYLAKFSCFGAHLSCAAPGNGLISTVPPRPGATAPYAAMDGTSLASPAACGLLAGLLADSQAWTALPRGPERVDLARDILHRHCESVGLAADLQGWGLPATYPVAESPIISSKRTNRDSPRKGPKPGITLA